MCVYGFASLEGGGAWRCAQGGKDLVCGQARVPAADSSFFTVALEGHRTVPFPLSLRALLHVLLEGGRHRDGLAGVLVLKGIWVAGVGHAARAEVRTAARGGWGGSRCRRRVGLSRWGVAGWSRLLLLGALWGVAGAGAVVLAGAGASARWCRRSSSRSWGCHPRCGWSRR